MDLLRLSFKHSPEDKKTSKKINTSDNKISSLLKKLQNK